ncbi:uncharacterized protein LOC115885013 isoform X1 [Sitophilus oryzae]|uniref:Uncharacterized protein LOC115885013 isoform X1 n=1 Tax=Sitophilus oryzae TaxID=7048 RepID=A0A6J2Y8R1_SITOR|nr:uncharacterized protein LOC115885013 isoform X1 [Sitophilus oryzae]XP_030759623.1 uncharacterized protein LOC115885013 isoform X1 [Sitophilus oryzae]XP_030759630.1 uncharacterized protein LOC115885013 isoform X1 [Sitophilus oryzae]XP_030759636.1 uncharacterized protein LOC115885013 isoform X1 [Sitophilus oryzae]
MAGEPLVVQALYTFKGSNNDELCFKKGDVITVTQKDDGWWEGTLNDKTGWFPSNYVKECKDVAKPAVQQENQYKSVVLKDLIDSEKAHVQELEGLVTNFLQPLEKNTILTQDEYKQLTSNIQEVLETHQQLLMLVEQEYNKPGSEQRVGKLFLNWAPKMKTVHQTYCSLHPRAVVILDKYKDELTKYMESRGAASPGVLVLTTMLSKPFRRLDKYSGMLQELERHVEECHPDRGDTQRSVSIYKDIATTCTATRRQKELELQVLTGPVRGWEGPSLTSLGEIIYMGSVAVGSNHHDRIFVLFPTTLVILSVSHRLSAFIYEGKLFLSGLIVTRLEDTDGVKNAFDISAPMIDKRIVICQSREEADHWVEILTRQQGSRSSVSSTVSHKVLPSQAQYVPQPPPHLASLDPRGYCNRSSVLAFRTVLKYLPTYPPAIYPSAAPYASLTKFLSKKIKDKILTRKLLRNLLYSEHLNKRNLNVVKIRHHKTECTIMTKNVHLRDSVINCDSDSETDSDSSDDETNLRRQNAFERHSNASSSDSSNPFGYIRYYNPKSGTTKQPPEKYESFIDYGQPHKVSEPDEVSVSSFKGPRVVEELPKKPSIVLTSTAKVNLLQKQLSEESNASSCMMPRNPGLACENLHTLNESFEMQSLNVPDSYIPLTRQSCPTKLVGNKFNESSLTAIYIPSYSTSENNIFCRSKPLETPPNSQSSSTTHSSSLEVSVNTLPLPDRVVGELLYGDYAKSDSVETDLTEQSTQTVIKPPTMFHNSSRIPSGTSDIQKLEKSNVPFRKHSINSDKPKRRCSIQINPSDLKRCVSSRYLNMRPAGNPEQPSTSRKSICRCGSEYCHSPRSSDSGMAGSCTLNSPDLGNAADVEPERNSNDMMNLLYQKYENFGGGITLSDIEARNFESQCPCSSPFGSTPRTSGEASRTRDSLRTTSVASIDIMPSQWDTKLRTTCRTSPQKSKSTSSLLDYSNSSEEVQEDPVVEEEEDAPVFKSGLYAHWWLKAKLPPAVVRGIYETTRRKSRAAGISPSVRPKP